MRTMTDQDIAYKAPAVFAESPDDSVSEEYTFVPTNLVVNDLKQMGWQPVDAQQQRTRKKVVAIHSKHLVRFRHSDHLQDQVSREMVPEISLINGHDGLTRLLVSAGMFEVDRGIHFIIPDFMFQSVALRHRHYKFDEVEGMVQKYVTSLPDINEKIGAYKTMVLSEQEKYEFAAKAYAARWRKGDVPTLFFQKELVQQMGVDTPQGTDLWTIFRNVLENIMNGGLDTGRRTQGRYKRKIRTRKLQSIAEYLRVSKELWTIVAEIAARR